MTEGPFPVDRLWPDPASGIELDEAMAVSYTHLTLPTNREV